MDKTVLTKMGSNTGRLTGSSNFGNISNQMVTLTLLSVTIMDFSPLRMIVFQLKIFPDLPKIKLKVSEQAMTRHILLTLMGYTIMNGIAKKTWADIQRKCTED